MIFSVTTTGNKKWQTIVKRVNADIHMINEGGDAVFMMREPAAMTDDGVYIPSIGYQVASFAQGHWKEVEIVE
jgi:hypothetical protein